VTNIAERLECGGFSAAFVGRKSDDARGKAVINHRSPNASRRLGAPAAACAAAEKIHFDGAQFRRDIAAKAIKIVKLQPSRLGGISPL
jgi:hypothetical protein